ncbi:MAG: OsmC family protein [Betaproteobacteria bacterium]|nr:OsmC family protein [Betaproteobacteria bacterium]
MSEHDATIEWQRQGATFDYKTYSRAHTLEFEGGIRVPASAAPSNIPPAAKGAAGVDPEQAFVASLSSCHMLWFLHLAWQAKLVVDRYVDHASGILGKNAAGREAMTRVTLRPRVTFSGRKPSADEHAQLHEAAHHKCFIANSVKTEVTIEPEIA